MKLGTRLLLGLFCLGTLGGCATKMAGLMKSEAFTIENLKGGKVVVAGVVESDKQELSLQDASQNADLLRTQLVEAREGLPVQPAGDFIHPLGNDSYQAILREYKETGAVGPKSLALIKNKLGNKSRFIALARIESNTTEKSEREQDGYYAGSGKSSKWVPGYTEKMHTRTVSASIHVYDLQKMELSFTGQVTTGKDNKKQYKKDIVRGVAKLVNAVQGKEDSFSPHPDAPSSQDVFKAVFKVFAKNFPEEA